MLIANLIVDGFAALGCLTFFLGLAAVTGVILVVKSGAWTPLLAKDSRPKPPADLD